MAFVPLEKLLPKSGHSIYRLMAMASKRAMELADNAPKLIENPSSQKAASVALEEIALGKVELKEFAKEGSPAKGIKSLEPERTSQRVESVQV